MTIEEQDRKYGTRVRVADGIGPLGIIDPDNPRRFSDETVSAGAVGEIVAGDLPEGWILVSFDAGLCPVHPSMICLDEKG